MYRNSSNFLKYETKQLRTDAVRREQILTSRLLTVWILLTGCPAFVSAQHVQTRGSFAGDSIGIGDRTVFTLTARYPDTLNVLFPDSSYNFTPFDYQSRRYFPTRTVEGISYDSVVYFVSTFETDNIQSLRLPVFVVNSSDCTAVYSSPDSIILNQLVSVLPDSLTAADLPLRINVAYEPVGDTYNYPLTIASVLGLFLISGVGWLLFGDRIKRYWVIRRMTKKHKLFTTAYSLSLDKIKTDFSPVSAEATVNVWKEYLEDLERTPFTKMTTRETLHVFKEPSLEQHLRSIDRVIYGNGTATIDPFENLRTFADRKFHKKMEEVKNG